MNRASLSAVSQSFSSLRAAATNWLLPTSQFWDADEPILGQV